MLVEFELKNRLLEMNTIYGSVVTVFPMGTHCSFICVLSDVMKNKAPITRGYYRLYSLLSAMYPVRITRFWH